MLEKLNINNLIWSFISLLYVRASWAPCLSSHSWSPWTKEINDYSISTLWGLPSTTYQTSKCSHDNLAVVPCTCMCYWDIHYSVCLCTRGMWLFQQLRLTNFSCEFDWNKMPFAAWKIVGSIDLLNSYFSKSLTTFGSFIYFFKDFAHLYIRIKDNKQYSSAKYWENWKYQFGHTSRVS